MSILFEFVARRDKLPVFAYIHERSYWTMNEPNPGRPENFDPARIIFNLFNFLFVFSRNAYYNVS